MKRKSARWLKRAEEDLYILGILNPQIAPNVAAFLSQQAVEKCLKACWVELDRRVPQTHFLEDLWNAIKEEVNAEKETVKLDSDLLNSLTPYATTARYPALDVPVEKVVKAIGFAIEIHAQIKIWLNDR
jgi:HEPN domain-containing protein